MKFVHIADVHFDMPFTSLKQNKEWRRRKKLEQRFAFRQVIDYVKKENVELLLIAGDLWEEKYVEKETISYVIACLKEIPNVAVYIAPGNHDPLLPSSPYVTYEWPENVFIFGSEVGRDTIGDTNIYGLGFDQYEMDSSAIETITVEEEKTNLLVTHGTLNGATHRYHDIPAKWLEKFDYVALGHIHMPKVDDSHIIYPGSLVATGFDEPGEHGFVAGEIEKNHVEITWVPVEQTEFETLVIDVTPYQTVPELLDAMTWKEHFYTIRCTGSLHVDWEELKESLWLACPTICDIINETKVPEDWEQIAKQKTLKGIFTKKMLEEMQLHPEKEKQIQQAISYVYHHL